MNEIVKKFQEDFPEFVQEMKNSCHHFSPKKPNPFHIEGSIWAHTMMVAKKAHDMKFPKLLQYVSLLHDIGKPACRSVDEEKGRSRFFGHEPVSAFLALDILKFYGFSEKDIIHAFQLIALHTEPFKLEPVTFSQKLTNNPRLFQNLMLISKADSEGRFTIVPKEHKDHFIEISKERIFSENILTVTLMVGLPCSGKSILVEKIKTDKDIIVCRDDIIMEIGIGKTYNEKYNTIDNHAVNNLFEKRKREAIKSGKNVIFDLTNLSQKDRRKILKGFDNYKKKAIVNLVGMKELLKRNINRYKKTGKFIYPEVYDRMMRKFYPPMYDQFDEIEWILN